VFVCVRQSAAIAAEDPGRLVGRRPLVIGHEREAVVARVVGVTVESPTEVLESRQLALGDRVEPGPGPRSLHEPQEVIEAERRGAQDLGPRRVTGAVREPGERRLDSRGALSAGDARWTPPGGRLSHAHAPTTQRDRTSKDLDPPVDHGTQQHRRSEDATSLASVGRDEFGNMARAESLCALEIRPEPDVEDALVDDRIHGRLLGPRPNDTQRTPAGAHRFQQTSIDDVAGTGC